MNKITHDTVSDGPDTEDHEYAFDVVLQAVVRVTAPSRRLATLAMEDVIDSLEPTRDWILGFNSASKVKITEVSLDVESSNMRPFEIDGTET